jgi:hypothetical protein
MQDWPRGASKPSERRQGLIATPASVPYPPERRPSLPLLMTRNSNVIHGDILISLVLIDPNTPDSQMNLETSDYAISSGMMRRKKQTNK